MKSKVIKITKMEKKDTYGNTSFIIEFADGNKGFYTSKNEDQKKFVVGQEADYTIEEKQGKNGPYWKVTAPNDPAFAGGGFKGKPQVEPRIQMISFAASYTKDLIVAGKIGLAEFDSCFNKIYTVMTSKI